MESFVFKNAEKYCNVFNQLDVWGQFLFRLSVRLHEAGYDNTADGTYQGRVINAWRCRASKFELKQTCKGCNMFEYHARMQENSKDESVEN